MGRLGGAVEIFGPVPHADIPRLLGETDICVFPSVWEALGFVCLEAMAAGRGVIASGGSGMAEIIDDGCTGRLVPPRNPKAVADGILAMLADPPGRVTMGERAREHARTAFTSEVVGPLQEASYRRAIERGRPSCTA
jgi:glycogen(starch) synthase